MATDARTIAPQVSTHFYNYAEQSRNPPPTRTLLVQAPHLSALFGAKRQLPRPQITHYKRAFCRPSKIKNNIRSGRHSSHPDTPKLQIYFPKCRRISLRYNLMFSSLLTVDTSSPAAILPIVITKNDLYNRVNDEAPVPFWGTDSNQVGNGCFDRCCRRVLIADRVNIKS